MIDYSCLLVPDGQEEIKQHVKDLNDAVGDGAVWDSPITLEIYSPDVPTLNLIDLPGKL